MIESIGVILFWIVVAFLVAVGGLALAVGLLVILNIGSMR